MAPNGTVYVGGQGDFGYLRQEENGSYAYASLLDKVPQEDRKFLDVWRIFPDPSGVYFSSYSRIFRLDGEGRVKVWKPDSNFGRAVFVLGKLYVKTPEQGLLRMEGDRLARVAGGAMFTKLGVPDAVDSPGAALVATPGALFRLDAAGSVQPFPTNADDWLAKNLLYTIKILPGGEIAAGTRNGGLALLNPSGTLDRILSKADGLPDDFVNAVFPDRQGGVWIAGNNGIARFAPAITRFDASLGLEGDVQCMQRIGEALYVGTLKGLYRMRSSAGQPSYFDKVAGLEGGVFVIQPWHDGALIGGIGGVFLVRGSKAELVFDDVRPKTIFDISPSPADPSTFYAAGVAGTVRLTWEGGSHPATSQAGLFSAQGQEFRTVVEDTDGKVWATTREAVWRIDFRQQPPTAEKFDDTRGAPTGWKNARRFRDHIVFATVKGLRRYSPERNALVPDNSIGPAFADGHRDVFNVFENPAGKVWVTGDKYHALLTGQGTASTMHPAPLLESGIQEIYWALAEADATWAVGAKGVLHRWEPAIAGNPDNDFRPLTRRVFSTDSGDTIFGGAGTPEAPDLPWKRNGLRFEYAAPFHENQEAVEYQVKLEGNDRDWSAWTRETKKDYTHLPEGDYRFHVRARTPHGAIAEDSTFAFAVLPPWYRAWWAYGIYMMFSGIGVWGVVRLRTRQLERDKHELEEIVAERTVEIRQQRDEIHAQERKSHSLLLNILPATVADELKSTGSVQPVGFDDVTVCFTDFVGFTLSSEKLPPADLVDALNEYFTAFDEIVARHGLEKLKTIGDSYMFASGLPKPSPSHAVDAVLAALEMVSVVERLSTKAGGTGWNIRVGLHSGPVVAGVVGTRKFAFDIWGNTVNFAARMESSGVPGRVNISEATFALLHGLIDCEERGRIKIKEGRELPMFLANAPGAGFTNCYKSIFGHPPQL